MDCSCTDHTSGDEVTECPVCFVKVRLSILDQHVNSCLDSLSPPAVRASARSSLASPFDTSNIKQEPPEMPRKRPRGDLCSWVGAETPKKPVPNDAKSRANAKSATQRKFPSATAKSFFNLPSSNGSPDDPGSKTPQTLNEGAGISTIISNDNIPLADQMRPKCLEEFVGQEKILSEASMLRTLIASNAIPSMILWGPPGCGKTSLANIISVQCKETHGSRFVKLSATSSGVNDVKEAIRIAKNEFGLLKRKTILFIDEIHRFNKLQQDTFLPYVEDGTITLIGATTENPSFSLNSALLSRCRVFVLEKLSADNIKDILQMTIKQLGIIPVDNGLDAGETSRIEKDALSLLAHMSDGDARTALNCLHLAIQTQRSKQGVGANNQQTPGCNTTDNLRQSNGPIRFAISAEQIKESLQRTHLLYDKKGDEHYNCISALHKSMRGHNANAALFWLGRMLEGGEDPLYVARRLIRFSSEDVGLADPGALNQAVAAYQACQCIGMPECEVILAQCVVYLSDAPKSVRVYDAYNKVKSCIQNYAGPLPGVPLHLRNAPTKLMKDLGYGQGYKYNPHFQEPVEQDYLPDDLKHIRFLDPN